MHPSFDFTFSHNWYKIKERRPAEFMSRDIALSVLIASSALLSSFAPIKSE